MPVCAAPFCSNRAPKNTKRGISFHRLPILKEQLLKSGHKYVCVPKMEDCFEVDHRYSLLRGNTHTKKKKPVAIPTIFKKSPSVTPFKRHASERRRKNKEKIEVSHFAYRRLIQTWPGKPGVYLKPAFNRGPVFINEVQSFVIFSGWFIITYPSRPTIFLVVPPDKLSLGLRGWLLLKLQYCIRHVHVAIKICDKQNINNQ